MKSLKVLVWNSQIFVGHPKICLFSCFANTCVPPETPKRGIFFWVTRYLKFFSFEGFPKGDSIKFQGYLNWFQRVFQGIFKLFRKCQCDSKKFQKKSLKGVSRMFQESFVLQFSFGMALTIATRAEGGFVLNFLIKSIKLLQFLK